ncbi:MAG: methyl-accepting chemotaxis protein [Deltaproteobacteria bacterium]|nr:methyl-accepting chemotaxis protein [Deltaproteobacteria bacterium]
MKLPTIFRTLKFKVFAISVAAVFIFSVITTSLFGLFFFKSGEKHINDKLVAMSLVLSSQLITPLDFGQLMDDKEISDDGNSILKSASNDSDFIYGVVYRTNGSLFAKYGNVPKDIKSLLKANDTGVKIGKYLNIKKTIKKEGKPLGFLYMGYSPLKVQNESLRLVKQAIVISFIISLIFISLFYVLIIRTVIAPVFIVTNLLKKVGEGDIREFKDVKLGTDTIEITQMFEALSNTTAAVRKNISEMQNVATILSAASDDVFEQSSSLSVAANEQATAVNETTVTLEEIEKTGNMTSENASNIQKVSSKTERVSKEGYSALELTKHQMIELKNQVNDIVESSNKLKKELEEVDRIIESVAGVTQQSHTLSINASIEAVKAGDAGKGFAVVANNIRTLSQQSRLATEQVRKTLTEIQTAIAQIVIVNEKGLTTASNSVKSIEHTGTIMNSLIDAISQSSEAAKSIAHNTMQQSTGIAQTSRAMSDINQVTKDNLITIDLLKSKGQELKGHAETLHLLVKEFRIK